MNVSELQQRLMAAARANPPAETVPYAFEKRIMARLAGRPAADLWESWSQLLWRAVAPSLALTVLLAGLGFFLAAEPGATALDNELEDTVLAAIEHGGETW